MSDINMVKKKNVFESSFKAGMQVGKVVKVDRLRKKRRK